MHKFIFSTALFAALVLNGFAQVSKPVALCTEMPNIMQQYYADVTALNRVYVVNGAPEKAQRYRKQAEDYRALVNDITFTCLPNGCIADYVLFRRDLQEAVVTAAVEA